MVALLAVALTAGLTFTSAAVAQAAEPVDIGPDESQAQVTQESRQAVAVAATDPGTFASLEPARILDTRVGNGAPQAKVGGFATVGLQVTGRGGVPDAGVAAVVVNVTVTGPSTVGFITVYPTGTTQPTASNLNFTADQTIPNLVTVKVGTDGKINLTNNSAGSVHLIADVAGYYLAGTPSVPGAFVSLDPARVLDTRVGNGAPKAAVASYGTVDLQVTGRGNVPTDGVAAVVVNVTVTGPAAGGFITVYPSGNSQPTASNLNFAPGQTIPNLVTVKLGTGGKIKLTNNSGGTAQLIADVAGYYLAGTPTVPGAFVSVDPSRLLDTRVGNGAAQAPVPAFEGTSVQVTARGGVPAVDVAAVVVNVTATAPAAAGFITVFPTGSSQPTASNLNFTAGQSIPNLAAVKVGGNGRINLANNSGGTVHLITDIAGYFLGSPEELDEIWPTGWIFDDCGTDWDGVALRASPGISYSPEGPEIFFDGETYYDYYSGAAGELVVTASAEPGYVIVVDGDTRWVANGDGSFTGAFYFDVGSC
ncbi:MAG: hypothetical protein ABWZ36_00970 [Jiangellaceae bacterium]